MRDYHNFNKYFVMNSKHSSSEITNKENIESLDLAETPRSTLSRIMSSKNVESDEEARKMIIEFEYKMLQMYGPLFGVYAIPNLKNHNLWNCIIFIRKGFFKDAKFKFDLVLPPAFPYACPAIEFKTSIYHPLIKEFEGILDIDLLINQQWKYTNDNMLYNVFSNLEKMFTDKQYLENKNSYNQEAAKLLLSKPHAFIQRALASVQLSRDSLYSNEEGTSLIIKQYEHGELDPLKNKLQKLCQQNKAPEEKRKQFLDFLFSSQA